MKKLSYLLLLIIPLLFIQCDDKDEKDDPTPGGTETTATIKVSGDFNHEFKGEAFFEFVYHDQSDMLLFYIVLADNIKDVKKSNFKLIFDTYAQSQTIPKPGKYPIMGEMESNEYVYDKYHAPLSFKDGEDDIFIYQNLGTLTIDKANEKEISGSFEYDGVTRPMVPTTQKVKISGTFKAKAK